MKFSKISFREKRLDNGAQMMGVTGMCRGYLYHAAAALYLPDGVSEINNEQRQRLKQRAMRNLKREFKRIDRLD